MHVLGDRLWEATACHRPAGEAAEAAQPIVHDDGPGRGDIEREGGRNADEMMAAGDHAGAEHASFGPEHIGCLQRVGEGRQLDRLVEKLDADQPAAARQAKLVDALPMIEGKVRGGPRCVGDGVHDARIGADGEGEACAEGVGRAKQIAEIDGLRGALDADGEKTARACWRGFHGAFMP